MKKTNVCDFSDILKCAQKLGYGWNEAHEILVKANYCAMYGPQQVYLEEITEEECPNEDARKILLAFFEQEKVKEFQINPKGG